MPEKIIVLQRILPYYRVGFFKKFSRKYTDAKIIYGQPYTGESLTNARQTNNKFFLEVKNYYFTANGKIFLSGIYSKIFKYKPSVIISVLNVGNLNIYILLFLKYFLKYKIILWTFGYDPFKGFNPEKKFKDKIRLFLAQTSDAVIFYWWNGLKEISKYSKKTSHYFIAPNTLDTEALLGMKKTFDIIGKEKIKAELKVTQEFHFVYIGRLIKEKQVDILLKAFDIVQKKNYDCGLSIIGDGPETLYLKNLTKQLNITNINFWGEILDDEVTGKWIYISDAFVMPGRLGLSVVHSFCFGTPVISQKKDEYFHGEGMGYIVDGINGLLANDGNIIDFADKMIKIISNRQLLDEFRENALLTAESECSIHKMMEGFEKAISYVNSK